MLKACAFLVKLPDLSDDAFFAHWRHPHGTMTRRIPHFRRYVQNHYLGDVPGLDPGPWLGVPAIWLDDASALAEAQAHPDYAPLDADGDRMYVREKTGWLIGSETVVRPQVAGAAAMPVKAMLLLAGGDPDAVASAAIAGLPGLAGVAITRPDDPEAGSPCTALVELSFADRAGFDAAWRDGAAILATMREPAISHGLLVLEERVIWPDADNGAR